GKGSIATPCHILVNSSGDVPSTMISGMHDKTRKHARVRSSSCPKGLGLLLSHTLPKTFVHDHTNHDRKIWHCSIKFKTPSLINDLLQLLVPHHTASRSMHTTETTKTHMPPSSLLPHGTRQRPNTAAV
ncbi:unnamed protein product, partial [Ectocarpus sp. 6 AP-2014]